MLFLVGLYQYVGDARTWRKLKIGHHSGFHLFGHATGKFFTTAILYCCSSTHVLLECLHSCISEPFYPRPLCRESSKTDESSHRLLTNIDSRYPVCLLCLSVPSFFFCTQLYPRASTASSKALLKDHYLRLYLRLY